MKFDWVGSALLIYPVISILDGMFYTITGLSFFFAASNDAVSARVGLTIFLSFAAGGWYLAHLE